MCGTRKKILLYKLCNITILNSYKKYWEGFLEKAKGINLRSFNIYANIHKVL